ncbi:MAG: winged helix DNA-binding domain-containing protein [Actinomycetota bacterium]
MRSAEIVRHRMHSQRLWGHPLDSPEKVVRWLGALQAQEYAYALWSVAQRAAGVDEAAMNQALATGTILRTHLLRPTWHFVLPEDIRWILKISAPRVNAFNAYYYRKHGLDDELFATSNASLANALEQGGHLTRKELANVLETAGILANGPRLGMIMMRAELDAVICSGAPRGKQQTYALVDERAPAATTMDTDEALAELTRRYFTARGPATLKDYLRWSSLTAAEGKRGLGAIDSELEREVIDGRTYWFATPSLNANKVTKVVDLVQGYDECIMSYSESRDVLLASVTELANTPHVQPFLHAILLDGRLIGHWRRVLERGSVAIETSFYRSLGRGEMLAFDTAAEDYGRFVATPVKRL